MRSPAMSPFRRFNEQERLEQCKLWRSMYGEIIVETYVHNTDAINWFVGARPSRRLAEGTVGLGRLLDHLEHLTIQRVQMTFAGSQMTTLYRSTVSAISVRTA